MRTGATSLSILVLLAAAPAGADECASYGPVAALDVPGSGRSVLQNIRFRVGLHPTCGGLEGGPEHSFRVIDAQGVEATHKRYSWTDTFLEITPAQALAPGSWRLQVRRPMAAGKLGEWETLAEVGVEAGLDTRAPAFAGIEAAEAEAAVGTAPRSPCEVEPAWVIRTTLTLSPATDDHTRPDELIYQIESRPEGEPGWTRRQTFRPAGRRFTFDQPAGWGQAFDLRVVVRDMAGNQTFGRTTAAVHNPPKPAGRRP